MHDELRDAFKRVEPPQGFAERVMAKASGGQTSRLRDVPSLRRGVALARLAVAATLVLTIGGGTWYGLEMRRREGEEAKRQVLMSLNIAGSKLRTVQMKINHEQGR